MKCVPVTLTNDIVTLEPIALKHASDIEQAIDKDVFRYMSVRSSVITAHEVRQHIELQMDKPNTVAFAVIDNATGRAIGSTSYLNISADHYGLEIGSTWITKAARGTKVNPSMKYLMIRHAIEELGAIRVVLSTDNRNEHSKAAISKLGASYEGILRNNIVMPDGHFRDSPVYSITPEQWPTVRDGLLARIDA